MSVNKIQYMHAVYIHVSLLRNSCTENTVRNQWENRWFNHYNECLKWVTYFINICSLFTVQTGTGTWSEKGKGIHRSSRVQRQADCWCRQVCWEGSSGTTSGNQWAVSVHAKKMFFLDMQRLVQTSVLLKKKNVTKPTVKSLWITRIELVSTLSGPGSRLGWTLWCAVGLETDLIHPVPLPTLAGLLVVTVNC